MPRGIPHSRFLGWAPDDQDKALAWLIAESAKCPGCGTVREEWLAKDGKRMAIPPAFEVEDVHCFGCEERARYEKFLGEGDHPGTHVVLVPTDMSDFTDDGYPEEIRTDRLVPIGG